MSVKVLHVGDVAAESHNGSIGERAESLHVGESRKRAVRCYRDMSQLRTFTFGQLKGEYTKVVGGDDNAILEFDCYDRGTRDDWLLCVCCWAVVLHERGIVGAVNVVSGLQR